MTTCDLRAICSEVSSERLQRHLEWFANVRRDTGGAGEHRAAAYIGEQVNEAGVPIMMHEFDAFLSYPIRASLTIVAPETVELRAVTHSFARSVPEGLACELVAVDETCFQAATGRAALVDGLATPLSVLQAMQAGCTAVIFANQDSAIHNMIATTIWGTPGLDQLSRLPKIAVVSVNKESGDLVKELLRRGQRVEVRITTEVDTGWFRSKLPEVRIPGAEEPDRFCLVGGHYCAWHEGITDNATGDACLIEMARILWAHRKELSRGVRICWWPGHSHGRYSGSTWYADTFFTELAEQCVAYHNIDSPGVRGATWYIARHTSAEIEQFCQAAIEQVTGQANAPVHRPSRAADQSFLANGVPSFSTYPFLPDGHPDKRPWTGGSANAWWWHTEHDTLDKADATVLARDTCLSLTAVVELVNAPVLPFDYGRTATEIGKFLEGLQVQVRDHLDVSGLFAENDRFRAAVARLEAAKAESGPTKARTLNDKLMRLGRILNPVIYSQVGRFAHDPAEWSPIMRATKQYTFAALAKGAALPLLAGQRDYGFLRAQIVREANRVRSALREAVQVIDEHLRVHNA